MCGIVGYSGLAPITKEEVQLMLVMSGSRGEHATGIGTPETVIKSAISPKEFIKQELPKEINTFVGHTRYATMGAKTDRNAHPFRMSKLVGVHNGSLSDSNYRELKEKFGLNHVEVDSELIYELIDMLGLEEALSQMEGLFALAWIDHEGYLNMYRAHDRPIFIGWKDENLYFGSEQTYLKVLGCEGIESLEEFKHYKYQDGILYDTLLRRIPKKKTTACLSGMGFHYNDYSSYLNRNDNIKKLKEAGFKTTTFRTIKNSKNEYNLITLKQCHYDHVIIDTTRSYPNYNTTAKVYFLPTNPKHAHDTSEAYEQTFLLPLTEDERKKLDNFSPLIATQIDIQHYGRD